MSPGALSLLDKVTSYSASKFFGYPQASDAHFKELQKLQGEVVGMQQLLPPPPPPLPPPHAAHTPAPLSETSTGSDLTEEGEED